VFSPCPTLRIAVIFVKNAETVCSAGSTRRPLSLQSDVLTTRSPETSHSRLQKPAISPNSQQRTGWGWWVRAGPVPARLLDAAQSGGVLGRGQIGWTAADRVRAAPPAGQTDTLLMPTKRDRRRRKTTTTVCPPCAILFV